ncbi:speckle targeted PIP5K1A-regulated poly(A) polymerase isoform X1 [Ixodes scapularis]|nr:speckle targeted PIP5K1A-regulated poly(A) polymerase isoform X1 [Ixodes scapularis]
MAEKRELPEDLHDKGAKRPRTERWPDECTVFVAGDLHRTSEAEIREAFSKYGTVQNVTSWHNIPRKGAEYSFVNFLEPGAAAAVAGLKRVPVGQVVVKVRPKLPPRRPRGRQPPLWDLPPVDEHPPGDELLPHLLGDARGLDAQVGRLCELVSLSEESKRARAEYCSRLCGLLRQFFPACSLDLFGSSVNGYGARGCDLDLFLDFGLGDPDGPQANGPSDDQVPLPSVAELLAAGPDAAAEVLKELPPRHRLRFVCKALKKRLAPIQVCCFISARVPIVKLHDPRFGLSCDINCTSRLSLVNTRLLQLYNAADPRVRPLVVFVRTWMRSHFLLTGRGNTLTSYAASMLVVCWLQRCARPPVLPTPEQMMARHAESGGETCEVEGRECGYIVKGEPCAVPTENRQTLAELVRGFFDFCASLNFDTHVVCLRTAELVERGVFYKELHKTPEWKHFRDGPMVVQDPLNLAHNVAASASLELTQKLAVSCALAAEDMAGGPVGVADLLQAPLAKRLVERSVGSDMHRARIRMSGPELVHYPSALVWAREVCSILLQLLIAYRINYRVAYREKEATSTPIADPSPIANSSTNVNPSSNGSLQSKRNPSPIADSSRNVNMSTNLDPSPNVGPSGDANPSTNTESSPNGDEVAPSDSSTVRPAPASGIANDFVSNSAAAPRSRGRTLLVVECHPIKRTWTLRRRVSVEARAKAFDPDPLTVEKTMSDLSWDLADQVDKALDFELRVTELDGQNGLLALDVTPEKRGYSHAFRTMAQAFFDRKALSQLVRFYTLPDQS